METKRGRPTNADRIEGLETQVAELQKALVTERGQNEGLSSLTGVQAGTTMVPVKNISEQNIGLSFVYQGRDVGIVLEPRGMRQSTTIPLDYWNELSANKIVTLGMVIRTDIPNINPNAVEDIDVFLEEIIEADIKDRINQLERPGLIQTMIIRYERTPKNERSNKQKLMLTALRDRLFEVAQIRTVETDEDAGL